MIILEWKFSILPEKGIYVLYVKYGGVIKRSNIKWRCIDYNTALTDVKCNSRDLTHNRNPTSCSRGGAIDLPVFEKKLMAL